MIISNWRFRQQAYLPPKAMLKKICITAARLSKSGIVRVTVMQKLVMMTNSIFSLWLFPINGSGNKLTFLPRVMLKKICITAARLSKSGIVRVTVMQKLVIRIKKSVLNSIFSLWLFWIEGSGNLNSPDAKKNLSYSKEPKLWAIDCDTLNSLG